MSAIPDSTLADCQQLVADLQRQLAECRAERDEALEYQTATSDVLNVISRSTFDLQPVLDTLVATAARLCGAEMAHTFRREGDLWRLAASFGFSPEYVGYWQGLGAVLCDAESPLVGWRCVREARPVHVHDTLTIPGYPEAAPGSRARTVLGVPLLRGSEVIGNFVLARTRVEPFTERQIELVRTFADQAVIAIENTRLITETREALEQQTATAEVLQVINSSPGDLVPVFDAILEKGHRLCSATRGALALYDGESFRAVAIHGYPEEVAVEIRRPYGGNVFFQRIVDGDRYVQIPDFQAVSAQLGDPVGRAALDHLDMRTWLAVPLRKEGVLLGYISAIRSEVRPFSEKEIALLENFAAQAVIAMENARLLTQTREALDQQTATAEVLQVINSSPGDLAPVFDAILEKAHTLAGASRGTLFLFDGEIFRAVASLGYSEEVPRAISVSEDPRLAALLAGERLVHVPDLTQLDDPIARAVASRGVRTNLLLPLRKDGVLLGVLSCNRSEVRPFADKQIALLQNFAAQAVIAMENARLLTETREALEQQTATAEVLGVINSLPGDIVPVFDAILERAHRLCGAIHGSLQIYDGEESRAVAVRGVPQELADGLRRGFRPGPNHPLTALLSGDRFVQIPDMAKSDDPVQQMAIRTAGMRTRCAYRCGKTTGS